MIGDHLIASGDAPRNAAAGLLLVEALTRAGHFDAAEAVLKHTGANGVSGNSAVDAAIAVARSFIAARKPIGMPDALVTSTQTPLLLSGLWLPDGLRGPTLPFDATPGARPRP